MLFGIVLSLRNLRLAMTADFDPQFIAEIKEKLESEQERLNKDLQRFAHKNPQLAGDYDSDFPNYGDDRSENASEVAQYDTNLRVEQTMEKKLRDVMKALQRLNQGEYGICKYCKMPIEEGRLRARPMSGSCVSCKKTLTQEV